jgi:multidrug efflux pump subunit AcrB
VGLDDFEKRKTPDLNSAAIAGALNGQFMGIQDAFVLVLPPPPVNGIGTAGGFKMMIEDRGNRGYSELYKTTQGLIGAAMGSGKFGMTYTGYTVNVPQLEADVDREKAKSQGVPLANLYETLQINLGSLYVNDFNRFGRTYQVVAQAEQKFRDDVSDITRLKTRNMAGEMVPIGSLVKVNESFGPDRVFHYNGYLAADISGSALPPLSSGQGEDLIASIVKEAMPGGFEFEWTDLTYQKIIAGNTAIYIYPLCILLVFMVLAAQYESLRLPLAIILIVPLCLLFALIGVFYMGGDNNIFTQIGFIVLIGLACKNAILIVEFAKENYDHGKTPLESALEACRLRLRPILMTSIAFIAGVYPLVVSTGAGAEMRRAMGTAVFSGMIGVTFLGLFLTPVFYVLVMLGHKRKKAADAAVESTNASLATSH